MQQNEAKSPGYARYAAGAAIAGPLALAPLQSAYANPLDDVAKAVTEAPLSFGMGCAVGAVLAGLLVGLYGLKTRNELFDQLEQAASAAQRAEVAAHRTEQLLARANARIAAFERAQNTDLQTAPAVGSDDEDDLLRPVTAAEVTRAPKHARAAVAIQAPQTQARSAQASAQAPTPTLVPAKAVAERAASAVKQRAAHAQDPAQASEAKPQVRAQHAKPQAQSQAQAQAQTIARAQKAAPQAQAQSQPVHRAQHAAAPIATVTKEAPVANKAKAAAKTIQSETTTNLRSRTVREVLRERLTGEIPSSLVIPRGEVKQGGASYGTGAQERVAAAHMTGAQTTTSGTPAHVTASTAKLNRTSRAALINRRLPRFDESLFPDLASEGNVGEIDDFERAMRALDERMGQGSFEQPAPQEQPVSTQQRVAAVPQRSATTQQRAAASQQRVAEQQGRPKEPTFDASSYIDDLISDEMERNRSLSARRFSRAHLTVYEGTGDLNSNGRSKTDARHMASLVKEA